MPIIRANDINLYYELYGPETAPALVLNNGVIMNAATSWVFQTPTLSAHYRLLQYDCRGQGGSDHPNEPYSMELHADDLAALLEALEIEHAHIAGISYGGEVAQAFALKYPDKTRSLILMDTVSEVGPELRLVIESWVDALKAEDLAPRNGGVIDTVGWVYFKKGDYEKALEKLKQAVQLMPNSPTIHYHLGMVLYEKEQFQSSVVEFSNALSISTTFDEAEKAREMIRAAEEHK